MKVEKQDKPVGDIKEAMQALAGNPHFARAGIDATFIDMFARNMNHFDKLPEDARQKIKEQFAAMAVEQSYRTAVDEKSSEARSIAMANWFKGVNQLLAMVKHGVA